MEDDVGFTEMVGGVTTNRVEPVIEPEVALIVVVPAASALARPFVPVVLLMVATLVALELQVTDGVRLYVLPVLNVPVAKNCWVPPTITDGFIGVTAIDTRPEVVPCPTRLAVWGLLLAVSDTLSVPVRVPTTVGVKVTLIVHFLPAPSEVVQVLVCAKSPATDMPKIVTAALKLLVSVTEMGLLVVPTVRLEKLRLVEERLTGSTPVPVMLMVCGLLLALSVRITDPVTAPVAVGVKVTEIVQLEPAGTSEPQVLV
jgi:hypothetical protein